MWLNSDAGYGWVSKLLHWLTALAVVGLFVLGLWMVDLDYFDRWYHRAPDIHRSIGMLLMLAMIGRCIWMLVAGKPKSLPNHRRWEVVLARVVHGALYVLVFAVGLSGYLISTADGGAVEVFNWFSVPSSGKWIDDQEDVAGEIHEWLAFGLVAVSGLHALAALKHHVVDKDSTLKRIC